MMENSRRNWDFAQNIWCGVGGRGGPWCQDLELLFLQRCKALSGSKVGDKYLTFLMQNTKYCKVVTFECRKVSVWQLKCAKHWTNYGAALSISLKKANINPKQKNSIHFDFFRIKKRKAIQCNGTYTCLIENLAWLHLSDQNQITL